MVPVQKHSPAGSGIPCAPAPRSQEKGLRVSRNDDALGGALARWVAFSVRHGVVVATLILLASVAAAFYAGRNLGFNTNANELFSDDLRFQRMIRSFEEHFPQLTDSLLIVVDGETAESVRSAADALAARLRQRGDAFTDVYFPGEEAFFAIAKLKQGEFRFHANATIGKTIERPTATLLMEAMRLKDEV